MSDLAWSSALSPESPSIPHARDWSIGLALALAICAGGAAWYSAQDHSLPEAAPEVEEKVLLSLGGSAPRRIEAPPPPQDAPASDTPPPLAERARNAAPIAPPPEPRAVATWTEGNGSYSSGTGGTAAAYSPPPAPKPKPQPQPQPQVNRQYVDISTEYYSSQIQYPFSSLENEEEGTCDLLLTIERDGRVASWKLVKSTGYKALDAEIRRVANKVKRVDPLPDGFPFPRTRFTIQITFKLQQPE